VASATTLIVEDDADLREMLEEHLVSLGCRVLAVASAEAAPATVETETPDLVLSDVHGGCRRRRQRLSHARHRHGLRVRRNAG
jgi:CheY-like chemotaxis protein